MKRTVPNAFAVASQLGIQATDEKLAIITDLLLEQVEPEPSWLQQRLREPSTQRGLVRLLIGIITLGVPPAYQVEVIAFGLVILGTQGAVTPDRTKDVP